MFVRTTECLAEGGEFAYKRCMMNAPPTCRMTAATDDRGGVGEMDIFKVRILAALESGELVRRDLFRRVGSPKVARFDAACEDLAKGGSITIEERPVVGKTGWVPRYYAITNQGIARLSKYMTDDGNYEVRRPYRSSS